VAVAAALARGEGEAVALARGEREVVTLAHGNFRGGWEARTYSLYSARASQRQKFTARDSVIAHVREPFFSHTGLAPPLKKRGRIPAR
jgi:hypothetical protein